MLEIIQDENYGRMYVDENNNRWNADFYTEQEAQTFSKTLVDCKDCYNSAHLVNCVNCIECVNCNDCIDCEYCSGCDACSSCIDCHSSAFQYSQSGLDNIR